MKYESNYLQHHGIIGQRWGFRRFQNTDGTLTPEGRVRYSEEGKSNQSSHPNVSLDNIHTKTKDGKELILERQPVPKLAQFMAKYLPSVKNNVKNDRQYDIKADGKKVGYADTFDEGNNSLNVVWISVDNSERGKGYATSAMRGIIDHAKKNGYKQMTLEVPGDSPDARHIYEKLGFKALDKISDDDVWGGLTKMRLNFDERKRKA